MVLKDSDDPSQILTEVTPWLLSSYGEQGLEGMKEGFTTIDKSDVANKIALKGEWWVVWDAMALWVEYLKERDLAEDEKETIEHLRMLWAKKRTEKQKCFRITKDYSRITSKE